MRVSIESPNQRASTYINDALVHVSQAGWSNQDVERLKRISETLSLSLTLRATFIKGDATLGKAETADSTERYDYLSRALGKQIRFDNYVASLSTPDIREQAQVILQEYCSQHADALLLEIDAIKNPKPASVLSDDFRFQMQTGLFRTLSTVEEPEPVETIDMDAALGTQETARRTESPKPHTDDKWDT